MQEKEWFTREEDWIVKQSIIFNKNLVRGTFFEVKRLIKLIGGQEEGNRILDLCCGIGRHSLEFARLGYAVTGVDITQPYLDSAANNARKEGLAVEFVQSDMRNFCRPGYFDMVVNLCTSFGYLESVGEDLRVLENIYRSLKEGGRFVIEIRGKEVIAAGFQAVEEMEFDGYRVVAESRILDDWNMLECKRTVSKGEETKEIIAYHRLYSAAELRRYLEQIGFNGLQIYGDFSGSPYDHTAKSMVVVAHK
jgi:SAM-dependent methyltransferase